MQHYFAKNIYDGIVTLSLEDEHHVLRVMRMQKGDEMIAIFNNQKYLCRLDLSTKNMIIRTIKVIENNNELKTKITLVYSMPKGDKFELVLQKATELGVDKIVPLISERSLVKVSNLSYKMERWQRIIKEASEQAQRNILPVIVEPIANQDLSQYLSELNLVGNETLHHESSLCFFDYLSRPLQSVTVLIGCEGGFSQEEFSLYEKFGFKSVSFGRRILRSETAAIYALSVIAFMCEKQV